MLDLMRENEAILQNVAFSGADLLEYVRSHLNILDPEVGEEELIQAVAAEVAKLRALSRSL